MATEDTLDIFDPAMGWMEFESAVMLGMLDEQNEWMQSHASDATGRDLVPLSKLIRRICYYMDPDTFMQLYSDDSDGEF